MAHTGRFKGRHPLCDCPTKKVQGFTVLASNPRTCKGGSIAHPILSDEDMKVLTDSYRGVQ